MITFTERAETAMATLTAQAPRLYQVIIAGFG
jgi:hypothetical protein